MFVRLACAGIREERIDEKIIDRKIYDTETAKQLFRRTEMSRNERSSRLLRVDTLYLSPRGQRFLVRENFDSPGARRTLQLVEDRGLLRWLEEIDAGENVYSELGLTVEEG